MHFCYQRGSNAHMQRQIACYETLQQMQGKLTTCICFGASQTRCTVVTSSSLRRPSQQAVDIYGMLCFQVHALGLLDPGAYQRPKTLSPQLSKNQTVSKQPQLLQGGSKLTAE